MRVVIFSTDRNILKPGSAAFKRQQAYAAHFDSYTVFVGSLRPRAMTTCSIAHNATAYPLHPIMLFANLFLLFKELRKADVISSQDPFEAGLFGAVVSFFFRKPLHVQVHTDFYSSTFTRASVRNWVLCTLAPLAIRKASRIRVVSENIADALKVHGITAPITVLPIFVDIKRYEGLERRKHPEWKIALLSIGRFEKEKRFDKCIDVVAQLHARGHDAGLTLVGNGSEAEKLKEHARTLHVDRYVRFVPWTEDLAPFLSEADLVLVPSLYEGYGLVIIEALAAGIPVLATNVGVAEEAGAMVVPIEEFTDAAERWVSSGPRQATLMGYPYGDFESYVDAYCEDVKKTTFKR